MRNEILFVCAMDLEKQWIQAELVRQGADLTDFEFKVLGVGPIQTSFKLTQTLMELYEDDIAHVVNVGFAGGVKEGLQIGQVCHINEVHYEDTYFPIELQQYQPQKIVLLPIQEGSKTSLQTMNSFKESGNSIKGDLVDMEGYSVAKVCREFGLNCHIIKIVSDLTNKQSSHDFKDAFKLEGTEIAKTLIGLVTRIKNVNNK